MNFGKKNSVLNKVGPPVALWIVNRILTQKKVSSASTRLDRKVAEQEKKAKQALRAASRNVRSNPRLLTAGLAAIGVGVGLVARAASRRK